MDIQSYMKLQIKKFSKPALLLKEEIRLAKKMEQCKNILMHILYDKEFFIDLLRNHPKLNSKARRVWLNEISVDSHIANELTKLIKEYIENPSKELAKQINFDYLYVAIAADKYNKIYKNSRIKYILVRYYKIRDLLVAANIKEVLPYCYKYYGNTPFEDLFQTAFLAMTKATGKYCANRGFKFGTLATWFVREELRNYLRKDFQIEISHKECKDHTTLSRKLQKKEHIEFRSIDNPIQIPGFISEIENDDGEITSIFDTIEDPKCNNETVTILRLALEKKLFGVNKTAQYILSNLIGLNGSMKTVIQLSKELNIPPKEVVRRGKRALKKLKMNANIKFPR